MRYFGKLLPQAAKTFTFMSGVFVTVIFSIFMVALMLNGFSILGEVVGVGRWGGHLVGLISFFTIVSFAIAHQDYKVKETLSEKCRQKS